MISLTPIIVATSCIGSEIIKDSKFVDSKEKEEKMLGVLRKQFKTEFLERIDDIVVFSNLEKNHIKQIISFQLKRIKRISKQKNIKLEFDQSVIDRLVSVCYSPEFGARTIKRRIKLEIEVPLAKEILSEKIKEGDSIVVRFEEKSGKVAFLKN